MKVSALFLAACLALLDLPISHGLDHPSRRQVNDPCPPLTCANPQYPQGSRCGTCEGSQCMLRGCVHSGPFFFTWRPDPCTTCMCSDGMEICAVADCAPVQCFGFPVVTRPQRCCQECDFGVNSTECAAVPVRTRRVPVQLGDTVCQEEVVEYECDKMFIVDDDGTWFGCDAIREQVNVSASDLPQRRCGPQVSQVTYETVARCNKRRLDNFEIPQDYEIDPYSCYYVNTSSPTSEPTVDATGDVVGSAPPTSPPIATPLLLVSMMVAFY